MKIDVKIIIQFKKETMMALHLNRQTSETSHVVKLNKPKQLYKITSSDLSHNVVDFVSENDEMKGSL